MFDLKKNCKGEKVLVYTNRPRAPFERGLWIEVAHENDKEANMLVGANRAQGLRVEKDEKGFYRALVLST